MRKIIPLLSIGLIAAACSSKPASHDDTVSISTHTASKVQEFSYGPQVKNPYEPGSVYYKLALLLEANKSKSIVQKGERRKIVPIHASTLATGITPLLPVFDQTEIKPKHQQIANEALKKLPEQCWGALKNFYVRYDNPKQRGLAGATTMILSGNVPDQEFRALFMHEIGHVFDLNGDVGCLGGTIASGPSEFKDGKTPIYNDDKSLEFYRISWLNETTKKVTQTPEDFVSGYAAHDVFEDFAESHTMFVLHNQQFRQIALENIILAQKYNFFVTYMYPQGVHIATSEFTPSKKRPWDITKLEYNWL